MKKSVILTCMLSIISLLGCTAVVENPGMSDRPGGEEFNKAMEELKYVSVGSPGGTDSEGRNMIMWLFQIQQNTTAFYELTQDDISWFSVDDIPEAYAGQGNVLGVIEFKNALDSMESLHASASGINQRGLYVLNYKLFDFSFIEPTSSASIDDQMVFVDVDFNKKRYVMMYGYGGERQIPSDDLVRTSIEYLMLVLSYYMPPKED